MNKFNNYEKKFFGFLGTIEPWSALLHYLFKHKNYN